NCATFRAHNVAFHTSLTPALGKFDLVHTYIVLQHIPVSRGLGLIDQLLQHTTSNGACFLHVTLGRHSGRLREVGTYLRKNLKPLHWLLNVCEGKPVLESYMQSN